MKTGAYNFDIRIDQDENVYLIEIAPRNGGDWNPEAIQYATGIDLIKYTIKGALGEDCINVKMIEPRGYWATYVLNSDKSGVFNGLEIQENFLEINIVEYELLVKQDDVISELSGSHEKLGLMLLKFNSKSEMHEKIKNIGEFKACETVQLYIGDVECSVKRPIKELIDFKKIKFAVGETKEVTFYFNKEQLSFYDELTDNWKFESGEFKVYIGSSTSDIRLEEKFNI